MDNKKVYCNTCTYIRVPFDDYGIYSCKAPENMVVVDSFYSPVEQPRDLPKEINKDNNCPWYKERGN